MGDLSDPVPMEESSSSEKIDLSLDDIIKLNKKDQKATYVGFKQRNGQDDNRKNFRKFNRPGQQNRFRFRKGTYEIQQGFNRFRYMGRPMRNFYSRRQYNVKGGVMSMKGVNPLNRPLWNAKNANQFGQHMTGFRGPFYHFYRGPRGTAKRIPFGKNIPHSQPTHRQAATKPVTLNRGFNAQKSESVQRYQKVRSWRNAPSSGSILTVSLSNTKAPSDIQSQQHILSESTLEEGVLPHPQPKGIPLRFNFKATSNQTALTLNDRFTSLRIRGRPGQGPWGGSGRGRGRGRGGRMVIMQ